MLHRADQLLVRQKTMLINALRAHLAELGIFARFGIMGVKDLVTCLQDTNHDMVPNIVRCALLPLCDQLCHVSEKITEMDQRIVEWHRSNALSQRLETIPGIGPVTASALALCFVNPLKSEEAPKQFILYHGNDMYSVSCFDIIDVHSQYISNILEH